MRRLLDTCIIYDWMMGTLAHRQTIQLIEQSGAFVSAVSVWEMAIKHGLGKMPLPSRNSAQYAAVAAIAPVAHRIAQARRVL